VQAGVGEGELGRDHGGLEHARALEQAGADGGAGVNAALEVATLLDRIMYQRLHDGSSPGSQAASREQGGAGGETGGGNEDIAPAKATL
jgi:hypothetical protein